MGHPTVPTVPVSIAPILIQPLKTLLPKQPHNSLLPIPSPQIHQNMKPQQETEALCKKLKPVIGTQADMLWHMYLSEDELN